LETLVRLVAWNCAGGLHLPRKYKPLLALGPHIAVISECAEPSILARKFDRMPDFSAAPVWAGGDPDSHHGLAVFFFNGAGGVRHGKFAPELQWLLPVEVSAPRRFNLLAVLTGTAGLHKAEPGTLRKGLEFYRQFLTEEDAVIAGDFSNNAAWNRGRACNHGRAVETLEGYGLVSAYHAKTGEVQGQESVKTFYRWYREEQGHHIDHIFMPHAWTKPGFCLEVGSFDDWVRKPPAETRRSDHAPLVVDIGCG